jgi:hypothetical protein
MQGKIRKWKVNQIEEDIPTVWGRERSRKTVVQTNKRIGIKWSIIIYDSL